MSQSTIPLEDCGERASQPGHPGALRGYWPLAVCCGLVLLVGVVFGQTVFHDFIGYDDQLFVYSNPHVAPGVTLSGLWYALTDGPLGEWIPLSTLSQMVDCQLYGLSPAGHYLTNVLLHATSSAVLFLVLLRMTGDLWPSAFVAAVFAVHPLHVESVAWLAERKDVLSGLFFMLTLLAYARYVERPSIGRYSAVVFALAIGLMSKSMLVTTPCVLLLLDYWPLCRLPHGPRRLIAEKLPLFALSAASCWIVWRTHSAMHRDAIERFGLPVRLANAVVSYATYVWESFWPVDLAIYYPHDGAALTRETVAGSLLLLTAILAAAIFWRRQLPFVLVGWLWFVGMLLPVSGIVQLGAIARADRYTYLPQIGLAIAVAWGVRAVVPAKSRMLLSIPAAAAVVLLAAAAWRQVSYWASGETVWVHAIAVTKGNFVAHLNLGVIHDRNGRIEDAVSELRQCLACRPPGPAMLASAHWLLGKQLMATGETERGIAEYEKAVTATPFSEVPHRKLAAALQAAGRHGPAVSEWREALRLAPDDLPGEMLVQEHIGLADALLSSGEPGEAIFECNQALRLNPVSLEAVAILGCALAANGQTDEATAQLDRVLAADPKNERALNAMAEIAKERRGGP